MGPWKTCVLDVIAIIITLSDNGNFLDFLLSNFSSVLLSTLGALQCVIVRMPISSKSTAS